MVTSDIWSGKTIDDAGERGKFVVVAFEVQDETVKLIHMPSESINRFYDGVNFSSIPFSSYHMRLKWRFHFL